MTRWLYSNGFLRTSPEADFRSISFAAIPEGMFSGSFPL